MEQEEQREDEEEEEEEEEEEVGKIKAGKSVVTELCLWSRSFLS